MPLAPATACILASTGLLCVLMCGRLATPAASQSFCTRAMLRSTRSRSTTTAGVPNSLAISVFSVSMLMCVLLPSCSSPYTIERGRPHGETEDAWNDHEEPMPPRRDHSRGGARAFEPDCDGSGEGAGSRPPQAVELAERERGPNHRYGASDRKGIRPQDGPPHAHAACL